MLLGIVADPHVANHRRYGGSMVAGLNQRGRWCVETLGRAAWIACNVGCDFFVVLGDLFDHTRPTPQLVRATARALLDRPPGKRAMRVVVILGNHDKQSEVENDHAAASLQMIDGIEVYSEPSCIGFGGHQLILAPYRAGRAEEWLPNAVLRDRAPWARHFPTVDGTPPRRVILTHLGVFDDDTPPYLREAKDAVGLGQARFLCDAVEADALYAGNWHSHKRWVGRNSMPAGPGSDAAEVVIPGTLCPASYSDALGDNGHMVVYDSKTNGFNKMTIDGPRFETLPQGIASLRQISYEHARRDFSAHTFFRATVARGELDEAMQLVSRIEANPKMPCTVEVLVDEGIGPEIVRSAAMEAAAESDGFTIDPEWADIAPPEAGSREGVLERLTAYRKAAG